MTNFIQLQKDRIHPLIRKEISKVAETVAKYQITLARLKDLQSIEDPDNNNKEEEIARLNRTIRDIEIMIELWHQDLELLESIKTELES